MRKDFRRDCWKCAVKTDTFLIPWPHSHHGHIWPLYSSTLIVFIPHSLNTVLLVKDFWRHWWKCAKQKATYYHLLGIWHLSVIRIPHLIRIRHLTIVLNPTFSIIRIRHFILIMHLSKFESDYTDQTLNNNPNPAFNPDPSFNQLQCLIQIRHLIRIIHLILIRL